MNTFKRFRYHVALTNVDEAGNEAILYPENTAEDVSLKNVAHNDIITEKMVTLQDLLEALGRLAFLPENKVTRSLNIRDAGYIADARALYDLDKKIGNSDLSGYGDGTVAGSIQFIIDMIKNGMIGGGNGDTIGITPTQSYEITLQASKWDATEKSYTIHNEFIDVNSNVGVHPGRVTGEQYNALADARIAYGDLHNGEVKIYALGDIPTIDIPIYLYITPVVVEIPDTGLEEEIYNTINNRIIALETVLAGVVEIYVDNTKQPILNYSTTGKPEQVEPVKPETTIEQVDAFRTRITAVENKIQLLDEIAVEDDVFTLYTPDAEAAMFASLTQRSAKNKVSSLIPGMPDDDKYDASADIAEFYSRLSLLEKKIVNIKSIYVDVFNDENYSVVEY